MARALVVRLIILSVALFLGAQAIVPSRAETSVTIGLGLGSQGAESYNPILATRIADPIYLVYDTLVVVDKDFNYHPHLAKSWETSADGLTWTFKLRDDVKFHDGTKFDANVIKWWVPKFAGGENAYMVEAIDSVEVVDDYSFKFHMKHPDPNLLFNLSFGYMGIPSPTAYEKLGDKYGITGAVGTGPYMLKEFVPGQQVTLTKNPDFNWPDPLTKHKGPASIDQLVFRDIPDISTTFLELQTGGIDVWTATAVDFLSRLKAQPNITLIDKASTGMLYLPINVTKKPFDDIRVREAVARAINQKEIRETIFFGTGREADTFLGAALTESKVDPRYLIKYDPERAKKLLDEAGWMMGPGEVRVKDGQELRPTLWVQSDTTLRRVAEMIQAELAAVGIKAELSTFDGTALRDMFKTGKHELAVREYGWSNADVLDYFFSGKRLGFPNISMWNDSKAEALNAKAMTGAKSWDERVKSFTEYHEYILSQFVFAPIHEPAEIIAYNNSKVRLPAAIPAPMLGASTFLDMELVQ